MLNKMIKDYDFIDIKYDTIKSNVQENIRNQIDTKTYYLQKILHYMKLTFSCLLVSVVCFILVFVLPLFFVPPGISDPGKYNESWTTQYMDEVIAFWGYNGNEYPVNELTVEQILDSNLLDEYSKQVLKKQHRRKKIYFLNGEFFRLNAYTIYLGIEDGKDMIYIKDLNASYSQPAFKFESNLDYSFKSIIYEFEKQSNVKITEEFLESSRGNEETSPGILMFFDDNIDGPDKEYYIAKINGIIYTVYK